jgi:hypothetical protein
MEARYELVMSAGASGDIATYRQYRTAAVIKELEGCPRDKLCKAMWGGDPMKAMMGTAKIGAGLLKSEPFTLYEARISDRAARLAYESVKAGKERTDTTFVVILFEKANNDWKIGRVNFQSYVHGGSAPEKIEKYLTYPMNQFK